MDESPSVDRRMMRVVEATALEPLEVRLTFDDGSVKTVDVEPFLTGEGVMVRLLRDDPALFKAARAEDGTVVWPNGFDLDPDVLYYHELRAAVIGQRTLTVPR